MAIDTIIPTSAPAIPIARRAITPPVAGELDVEARVSKARTAPLKLTSADRSIRSMFLFETSPYNPIPNMAADRDKNRYAVSIIPPPQCEPTLWLLSTL